MPRDERFSKIKQSLFDREPWIGMFKAADDNLFEDPELGFPYFTEIDELFNELGDLPQDYVQNTRNLRSRFFQAIEKLQGEFLRFDNPELLHSMFFNNVFVG